MPINVTYSLHFTFYFFISPRGKRERVWTAGGGGGAGSGRRGGGGGGNCGFLDRVQVPILQE